MENNDNNIQKKLNKKIQNKTEKEIEIEKALKPIKVIEIIFASLWIIYFLVVIFDYIDCKNTNKILQEADNYLLNASTVIERDYSKISDINLFINNLIERNKIKNVSDVSIIYQHNFYSSEEELIELLNSLNQSKEYVVYFEKPIGGNHICDVWLNSYIPSKLVYTAICFFEGNNIESKTVKEDVESIYNNILGKTEYDDVNLNVIYTNDVGNQIILNKDIKNNELSVNSENKESLNEMIKEIEAKEKFDVKIDTISEEECNIYITPATNN